MNEIRFDIQHSEFGNLVVPIIDGKSLISILKEVELPFAKSEGSPSIAGAYDGVPKDIVKLPSEHLLGKPKRRYSYEGKSSVLECNCGESGCWSFITKVEVDEKKVRWSNFEQIHRPNWKYEAIGEFIFDRQQYEQALSKII